MWTDSPGWQVRRNASCTTSFDGFARADEAPDVALQRRAGIDEQPRDRLYVGVVALGMVWRSAAVRMAVAIPGRNRD